MVYSEMIPNKNEILFINQMFIEINYVLNQIITYFNWNKLKDNQIKSMILKENNMKE